MVPEYFAPNNARAPEQTAVLLPLASIDASPLNPRKRFDDQDLQQLADSLAADGLLQPIVVTPAGDRFVVVAGERRLRAAQRLNWTAIPAIVRTDVDDRTLIRLALLENLARTDLDPLEEAEGYRKLQELGMTQAQIAAAVHRSQPAIANAIRLLRAPAPVQAKVQAREISPSHVLALLRYEAFPEALVKLAEVAAEKRTPSKDLEKGLSYEFTSALTESKLSASLYRAEFDRAVCDRCPFGARVNGGPYDSYCLKPEHFQQLQKEAREKRKAETKAALEQASTDGTPALKLSSLRYGQYERLDWGSVPKGCTKKCECRRAAWDGTRAVQVCVKPDRVRQLRDAERKAEDAARRARQQQLAEACGKALDQIDQVRSRELALLAASACSNLDRKRLDALVAKHMGSTRGGGKPTGILDLDNFAALQPLVLVKVAVEALLSRDLENLQYRDDARFAAWYAGSVPKPRNKGIKKVPAAAASQGPSEASEVVGEQQPAPVGTN